MRTVSTQSVCLKLNQGNVALHLVSSGCIFKEWHICLSTPLPPGIDNYIEMWVGKQLPNLWYKTYPPTDGHHRSTGPPDEQITANSKPTIEPALLTSKTNLNFFFTISKNPSSVYLRYWKYHTEDLCSAQTTATAKLMEAGDRSFLATAPRCDICFWNISKWL